MGSRFRWNDGEEGATGEESMRIHPGKPRSRKLYIGMTRIW